MSNAIQLLLLGLDQTRSLLLRKTLRFSLMRTLFTQRAYRHLVFFCLAILIYLPLSLFFPVWIAILGPIMYGLPHIVSSLRFSGISTLSISARTYFLFLWISVTVLRVMTDMQWFELESFFYFDYEIVAMTLAMLGFIFVARPITLFVLTSGSAIAGSLVYFAWNYPMLLAAFLLLGHNFIGFFFWMAHASSKKDRNVAMVCFVIFCGLMAAILSGQFAFLYKIWQPQILVEWAKMDYTSLGKALAPWSQDNNIWFHFFAAYVFGQSLHYFVWLKAIPEQQLSQETPISFRLSFLHLQRSFGKTMWMLLIAACIGSLGIWFFFNMPEARTLYFAIASYHGFHEFAGLPFLLRSSHQRVLA